jgi:TRAP-type mannitol/chloroaromatic compound transport system permease large subunit
LLIAVTLQTSFLTPPLGFSLFFLRSVAPSSSYVDRVSGATVEGVTTRQIYTGGLPFIVIQMLLVVLLLVVPQVFLTVGEHEPIMTESEARDALVRFRSILILD